MCIVLPATALLLKLLGLRFRHGPSVKQNFTFLAHIKNDPPKNHKMPIFSPATAIPFSHFGEIYMVYAEFRSAQVF